MLPAYRNLFIGLFGIVVIQHKMPYMIDVDVDISLLVYIHVRVILGDRYSQFCLKQLKKAIQNNSALSTIYSR